MKSRAATAKWLIASAFGGLVVASYFAAFGSSVAAQQMGPCDRAGAVSKATAKFPHGKEKHKSLDCARCHKISAAKIDDTEFPGHNSCIECHNFALEALCRPVTFCGICHEGRPVSKTQAALFRYPKPNVPSEFGVAFSHPSHLKQEPGPEVSVDVITKTMQGVSSKPVVVGGDRKPLCMDCHSNPTMPTPVFNPPEVTTATGHPGCFACHGEKAIKPPTMFQCAACHKLGGPVYPRYWTAVKDFRHFDHIFDTRPVLKIYASQVKPADYLCSECHAAAVRATALNQISLPRAQYCNDCHNGRLGLPDPLAREQVQNLPGQ